MKNKILSLTIFFLPILAAAQEITPRDLTPQEASFGLRLAGGINYYEKPPSCFWSLAPSINLITSITHHHLMYDLVSNSIQTLNGYMFGKKQFDIYVFYEKNIKTPDMYLSTGLEKVMILRRNNPAGEFTISMEVGTNFHKFSGRLGFIFEPQWVFFRGYDR